MFSLGSDGRLSFRGDATDTYVSGDLGEPLRDDVEKAADVCPPQAITIED